MGKKGIMLCVMLCFCANAACATGSGIAIVHNAGELIGREGTHVVIEGKVAQEIWQHMMAPTSSNPHETYFDMGRGQIVIYTKSPVECTGTVRAAGMVVKIEGASKNPRRKETCTEYHVRADSWECFR